jgi:hypothetical protein
MLAARARAMTMLLLDLEEQTPVVEEAVQETIGVLVHKVAVLVVQV